MDPSLEETFAEARRELMATRPVRLGDDYLRAIERLEARDEYRSGSDRTWILDTLRRARVLVERARRVR